METRKPRSGRIRILYDGDCPFCTSYVKYSRLKARHEIIELINARERIDLVHEYAAKGFPIDDGMIVDMGGEVYFGADAMLAINNDLGGRKLPLSVFWTRRAFRLFYPLFRTIRNSTLRMLGRAKIR